MIFGGRLVAQSYNSVIAGYDTNLAEGSAPLHLVVHHSGSFLECSR
jgi:hypothetical protein